jgi:5-enolpyruvylshikimate-3-phosphate synthase
MQALRSLGGTLNELGGSDELPIEIIASGLEGGKIKISAANSSQFVSGLMLAAPLFEGGLTVELTDTPVSRPYLGLTIEVMKKFGVVVEEDGDSVYRIAEGQYSSTDMMIEPDASAASYFFAAAAITQGNIRVKGLHRNSWQGDIQFVDVLQELGAQVTWGSRLDRGPG